MVKIRKGSMTLTVPNRAYEKVYAPAGWELVKGSKLEQNSNDGKNIKPAHENADLAKETKPEVGAEPNGEEESGEGEAESEELEEDIEYVDPEELLEKPLEELDYDELIALAEYFGIETKPLKTKKLAREAIKAHQK